MFTDRIYNMLISAIEHASFVCLLLVVSQDDVVLDHRISKT